MLQLLNAARCCSMLLDVDDCLPNVAECCPMLLNVALRLIVPPGVPRHSAESLNLRHKAPLESLESLQTTAESVCGGEGEGGLAR